MHPEYPCAHCIQSGSVAAVVKAVLGTVDIAEVALTSPTAPGVTHRWPNLERLYRRGCRMPASGRASTTASRPAWARTWATGSVNTW